MVTPILFFKFRKMKSAPWTGEVSEYFWQPWKYCIMEVVGKMNFHSLVANWGLRPYKAGFTFERERCMRREMRQNVWYIHTLCSAFAKAANRPYINILYANSLWSTDSRRIAFGCLQNVHRTVECCLPHLGITSILNDFVFACQIRIPFAFRCKPGLIQ